MGKGPLVNLDSVPKQIPFRWDSVVKKQWNLLKVTTKYTVWGRSAPSSVNRTEPFHHYRILPVAFEKSCHFNCRVYWANSKKCFEFSETVTFRIKRGVCVPKEGVQNMSAGGSMVDFWRCRLLQSEDFHDNGHEDGTDSAVTRKQTYGTSFQSLFGDKCNGSSWCLLDQTCHCPGGKSMGEFLNYVSWGGRTQHNWETPWPGLASWIVHKGEGKLSASMHLSAVHCGYDVTSCTTLLLQDLPFHDDCILKPWAKITLSLMKLLFSGVLPQ